MIKKDSLKILFYEGYKGKETPRAVVLGDKEFQVDQIFWRKQVRDPSGKNHRIFKCSLEGKTVKITLSENGDIDLTFPQD